MAEHTPTTEEIRTRATRSTTYPQFESPTLREDWDRWLAAHDAEERGRAFAEAAGVARNYDTGYDTTAATIAEALADAAAARGVLAEEPEWEYGWNWLSHPYTEAKSFSPQGDEQSRADFAEKTGRQISPVQVYRRTPAVPAGPWVPVKQEGADDA